MMRSLPAMVPARVPLPLAHLCVGLMGWHTLPLKRPLKGTGLIFINFSSKLYFLRLCFRNNLQHEFNSAKLWILRHIYIYIYIRVYHWNIIVISLLIWINHNISHSLLGKLLFHAMDLVLVQRIVSATIHLTQLVVKMTSLTIMPAKPFARKLHVCESSHLCVITSYL